MIARCGSVRYSANRSADRLLSTKDATFCAGTEGGQARGKVCAATAANSSAAWESAAAISTRRSKSPLCEVFAGLPVQQDDHGYRIAVGVPVHSTANDRPLRRIHQHVVQCIG